jgi:hypothetical protein
LSTARCAIDEQRFTETGNRPAPESVLSVMTVRAGGAVCVGLSLLLAGGLASACSRSPSAPLPSPSSSPQQVAQIYLAAAKAHDCDLTASLTLAHTWNWCDDPRLLEYRSVGVGSLEPAKYAGRDERCVPFEMNTDGSSDGTLEAGWGPWELCFVKTSAGWRVYDQGHA